MDFPCRKIFVDFLSYLDQMVMASWKTNVQRAMSTVVESRHSRHTTPCAPSKLVRNIHRFQLFLSTHSTYAIGSMQSTYDSPQNKEQFRRIDLWNITETHCIWFIKKHCRWRVSTVRFATSAPHATIRFAMCPVHAERAKISNYNSFIKWCALITNKFFHFFLSSQRFGKRFSLHHGHGNSIKVLFHFIHSVASLPSCSFTVDENPHCFQMRMLRSGKK